MLIGAMALVFSAPELPILTCVHEFSAHGKLVATLNDSSRHDGVHAQVVCQQAVVGDPFWYGMHSDPRYANLLSRIGLPQPK
jgi:hypothetical protein